MIFRNFLFPKSKSGLEISQDEISLLLDVIPVPCVIINTQSKLILNLNGLTTELTKYGGKELVGLEIFSLLDQFPSTKIIEGKKYESSVRIRKNSKIPVYFEVRFLDQKKNTALVKITRDYIFEGNLISFDENIMESLSRLNKHVFLGSENDLYSEIASELPKLFNFSKVYIYLHEEENNSLKIINNKTDIFPVHLPVIEMERIKKINYWSPGKRVLTEIHRIGRKNGFSLVITTPLGISHSGLLVVVSDNGSIDSKQQQKLESYIGWINQLLNNMLIFKKNTDSKKRLTHMNLILSRFLEQSTDCSILVDTELKIIEINGQFQKLLHYSSYELVGQNFFEIIQTNQIKIILEDKNRDEVVNVSATNIYDRNGNEIPVKIKVIRIKSLEFEGALIIISDISEEINLEKTIDKIGNQAALGEVIADFAHEVRNPINNISTGLQLLRKKLPNEGSSIEIVDRMQSDCVRMNNLMESILSFSRQEISNFQPFDCVELISRINNRFKNKYSKNKITANLLVKSTKPIVLGDSRSIDQVFTNLISNSVDAMEKIGGELTIKLQDNFELPGILEIVISDTGYGIPEELKENIFDPFFTRKEKGTGLGLAISKRIIEAHNGSINVESSTSGTIFTIHLKLVEEE
jgi:two-component system, NtrC family, sensor histidine kinase AtoS